MRFFFSDFLYKSICCGYSFELHRQVDAIQMGTHNICLYKKVDKKYTGRNLKTTELLDNALIGVCVVIRSNTISEPDFPYFPTLSQREAVGMSKFKEAPEKTFVFFSTEEYLPYSI